jgi:SAM-dependent methyltransferase
MSDPHSYDAWYRTPRGAWIGELEYSLVSRLLGAGAGDGILDVGCGTGYFGRRFLAAGMRVTGVDTDARMLAYAANLSPGIEFAQAGAEKLPFADNSFDFAAAITSLCFVEQPARAMQEMWRVARKGIALGLLNRRSLFYLNKRHSPGYQAARWDQWREVRNWLQQLNPVPFTVSHRTTVFLPDGGLLARGVEVVLPSRLPWGGFLAVVCLKGQAEGTGGQGT